MGAPQVNSSGMAKHFLRRCTCDVDVGSREPWVWRSLDPMPPRPYSRCVGLPRFMSSSEGASSERRFCHNSRTASCLPTIHARAALLSACHILNILQAWRRLPIAQLAWSAAFSASNLRCDRRGSHRFHVRSGLRRSAAESPARTRVACAAQFLLERMLAAP